MAIPSKERAGRQFISPDLLKIADRQGIRYDEMQPGQSITVHAQDALTHRAGSFTLRVVSIREDKSRRGIKDATYQYEEGDFAFHVHGGDEPTRKLKPGDLLESGVTATFIPQTDYRMVYMGGIGVGRDHSFEYVNGEDATVVAHNITELEQGQAAPDYKIPDISEHIAKVNEAQAKRLEDYEKSKDEVERVVMEDLQTHFGDLPEEDLSNIKTLISDYSPNGQLVISSFLIYGQEDGMLDAAISAWLKAHKRHFSFEHPDIRGDLDMKASSREVYMQMVKDAGIEWPRPAPKDLVITLPEERKAQLTAKLTEYQDRLRKYGDDREYRVDSKHKIAVLKKLLENGSINPSELKAAIQEELGSDFDPESYNTAWSVMQQYCEMGRTKWGTGTGLPQV